MHTAAFTQFVNQSGLTPLTPKQLYNGLKLKARDPRKFVVEIEKCKVLSESERSLLREVQFRSRSEPVQERVEFFAPTTASFRMLSPTGETIAQIMNIISTTPDGDVLLTFTYAFGRNALEDSETEVDARGKNITKKGQETIARTIAVIRELVEEGNI